MLGPLKALFWPKAPEQSSQASSISDRPALEGLAAQRRRPNLKDVKAEDYATPEKYLEGAEIPTFYQFQSNLVADEDLKPGMVRNLEVDKRLTLPTRTHIRFLVTGQDVIHAFSVPSLGILTEGRTAMAAARRTLPLLTFLAAGAVPGLCSTLLSEWPMIMAHDSATTYLEGGVLKVINQWTKTQADGGFSGTLDCGARAFDLRAGPRDAATGKIWAHHGKIVVKKEVSAMLDEVVGWAAKNKRGAQDFVLLGVSHPQGDVASEVQEMLSSRHIPYITDCASLQGMTIEEALQKSALPSGGNVLAIDNCWQENWDASVACSGFDDKEEAQEPTNRIEYTCYTDSSSKDFPLNRLYTYINKTLAAGPPADGELYTVQAIWQETTASVIVGALHGSSIIQDEVKSDLNNLLASRIRSGEMDVSRLGMLELNNVCHNGQEVVNALFEKRPPGELKHLVV